MVHMHVFETTRNPCAYMHITHYTQTANLLAPLTAFATVVHIYLSPTICVCLIRVHHDYQNIITDWACMTTMNRHAPLALGQAQHFQQNKIWKSQLYIIIGIALQWYHKNFPVYHSFSIKRLVNCIMHN